MMRVLAALQLQNVTPVSIAELESADPALVRCREDRTKYEYYFTCTPSLLAYVMKQEIRAPVVAYVDTDLFFFSGPGRMVEEMGDGAIHIVPHRLSPRFQKYARAGKFNVGYVGFRRTPVAQACIQRWREQCIAWCHDRYENGRFADQGYLNDWPEVYESVVVSGDPGVGLAPWNIENYTLSTRGGRVFVDDHCLVFYHFEGYRRLSRHRIDPGLTREGFRLPAETICRIHVPYVNAVLRAERRMRRAMGRQCPKPVGDSRHDPDKQRMSLAKILRMVLDGRCIVVFAGLGWFLRMPILLRILSALKRWPCHSEHPVAGRMR